MLFISPLNGWTKLVNQFSHLKFRVWQADYTIYINSDENRFYLSIQSNTHANSGFADFEGTEKLRKKISGLIKNPAEDNFKS